MAGIDLSGLVKMAARDLQQQSHQELAQSLLASSTEIDGWLARARIYVEQNNINLRKEAAKSMDEYKARMAEMRMEMAAQEVITNSIINEGYRILNEIGESIRGEPITYSITITGSGDWGSVGNSVNQAITWEVDYSVFSKLIKTGTKRLTLKDSATIMEQLESLWIEQASENMLQQLEGQPIGQQTLFKRKEWSQQEINQYQSFHTHARRKRNNGKQIWYNRGQTLEAYLRWIKEKVSNSKYTRDMAMVDTAANNLPFYAGGDIGNIQVKGMNASVSNIDTMISTLVETQGLLHQIISQSQKLSNDVSQVEADSINADIDAAIAALLVKYGFSQT